MGGLAVRTPTAYLPICIPLHSPKQSSRQKSSCFCLLQLPANRTIKVIRDSSHSRLAAKWLMQAAVTSMHGNDKQRWRLGAHADAENPSMARRGLKHEELPSNGYVNGQ